MKQRIEPKVLAALARDPKNLVCKWPQDVAYDGSFIGEIWGNDQPHEICEYFWVIT